MTQQQGLESHVVLAFGLGRLSVAYVQQPGHTVWCFTAQQRLSQCSAMQPVVSANVVL